MNPEELFKQYLLCDGVVKSFHLDVANKVFKVQLAVRQILSTTKSNPCMLELQLCGVTELYLFEDFPTDGRYTDITLTTLDNGELYLSLDPYGNTGKPHKEDNWIIRASSISWQAV